MRHKTVTRGIALLFFAGAIILCPITDIGHIAAKPDTKKVTRENKEENKKDKSKKSSDKTDKKQKKSSSDIKKKSRQKGEKRGLPSKDYKEKDFKPKVNNESYAWMVFKTLLVLGFLVGGFYLFFRFVTKKAGIQVLGEEVVQILSVVPIGQNRYLQVVDLAGKVLVLGVADSTINLITEITDKEEIDRIRLMSSKAQTARGEGFQDFITAKIGDLIERFTEKKPREDADERVEQFESGVDLSFLQNQKKRLKRLNGTEK